MTINNCFLVSGNTTVNKKAVEEFVLIYKNEAIAKGTKADFQEQIKEIGKNIHHEKLWNDFVSLSTKGINTMGTNENVSVINLLKGIKNVFWWCSMINENPEIVRTILSKLSSEYLQQFTILITNKIGIPTWNNADYENAISYSLEINDSDNEFSKYRIVHWCGYIEKEKKFEVGYSVHNYYDKMSISPSNTMSKTLGIVNAFTPLKIIENEGLFLPTIVANYLTEEQLSEDKWTVLSNIAAGVLPELGAGTTRAVAILSRLSSGKKIKTVEELIEFLGKVDQNVMAQDLEKVGIEALFRGTTKNIKGELFTGNLNSIQNGASTSTDPIRAVIFGIESSSKPGAKGVLQVYVPKDLKKLNLQVPNRRIDIELEIIVNTSPENLSKFTIKEIPIEDARKLVNEIYSVDIPKTITNNSFPNSEFLLKETKKLTPKESLQFYNRIKNKLL